MRCRTKGFLSQWSTTTGTSVGSPKTITRLARRAFREGANAVFALDADEFLKLSSRPAFDRWMTIVPPPCCVAVEWQTYLPQSTTHVAGAPVSLECRRGIEAH